MIWREGSRSRVEVGADVALGLGTAYLWLERYEEAVHVLTRCLHLNDELDDKEGAYDASASWRWRMRDSATCPRPLIRCDAVWAGSLRRRRARRIALRRLRVCFDPLPSLKARGRAARGDAICEQAACV